MELQRTTAGTFAPPRTSGTEDVGSVFGRLIFLHRRSLTNTIEKPDCDTSAENFFHFPFLSPQCVSHFPLILNALQPFTEVFSTNVKSRRMACHILRARVSSAKTMLHSIPCSQESAQKHLHTFRKKRPSFPTPPPLSAPRHAQRCGERTSRVCAYTRTPQSVFVFCLHPSRWGLSSLIARALGLKTPPIFRPSPPLPTYAARVKVEAQKPSPLTH